MYKLIHRLDGIEVAIEMSYSACIDWFGRDTFKEMLAGDVENIEAYPINDEEAA